MSGTNTNPGQIDPTLLNSVQANPADVFFVRSVFHSGGTASVPAINSFGSNDFHGASQLFLSPRASTSPVTLHVTLETVSSGVNKYSLKVSQAGMSALQITDYHVVGWNADAILLSDGIQTSRHGIVIGDANLAADIATLQQNGNSMVFSQNPAVPVPEFNNGLGQSVPLTSTVTCFAEGTRIATPAGDVAIEDLAEGDMVTTLSGLARPVLWIGRRSFDCAAHPQPARVAPVEIAADAFGPGLPTRPLLLSPEHALFLDGAMVPVHCLINGTTIRQLTEASVTYYHIELPRHDVVLAEGLAAETYLDTGSRQSLIRREAAIAQAA